MELYYGWPACYQAELLRSDDPDMGGRVLQTAPFHLAPYGDGWVSAQYVSGLAIALDTAMAVLGVVLVAIVVERNQEERWTRRAVLAVLVIGLLLVAGYLTADKVSTHL